MLAATVHSVILCGDKVGETFTDVTIFVWVHVLNDVVRHGFTKVNYKELVTVESNATSVILTDTPSVWVPTSAIEVDDTTKH